MEVSVLAYKNHKNTEMENYDFQVLVYNLSSFFRGFFLNF